MAKPRVSRISLLCCLTLALSGLAAVAASGQPGPDRFLPDLDRGFVQVTNPLDGSIWAAWTYQDGAETDIALSRRNAEGVWSRVERLGPGDGESQLQPSLAVDEYGTTYLAYAEAGTGRVLVSARGLNAPEWTTPAAISPAGIRATAPSTLIAASRKLVVGFIVGDRVSMRQLSLAPPVVTGFGNDGPDPVGGTIWPPEAVDDTDHDDDGLIDDETIDHELEFTGPRHRGTRH